MGAVISSIGIFSVYPSVIEGCSSVVFRVVVKLVQTESKQGLLNIYAKQLLCKCKKKMSGSKLS